MLGYETQIHRTIQNISINFLKCGFLTSPNTSLASKTKWSALAAASGSGSRLLAGIAVARLLGPEANGEVALAFWVTELFVLIFSLGLPGTINRFLALRLGQGDAPAASGITKSILKVGFLLCALAFLAAYFCIGHFSTLSPTAEMTVAISFLIITQLSSGICQAILNGLHAFRAYAMITMVSSIFLIIGQVIGTQHWGTDGAIYGALASYVIGAALLLRAVVKSGVWGSEGAITHSGIDGTFLAYARDAWLAGLISAVVWGRAELFFLGEFSTKTEAGYFVAGLVFSSLIIQTVNLITGALLPHLSNLIGRGCLARVESDYRQLTVFIALVTFPITLGGIALMPDIMLLVLGSDYIGAVPAARCLMATGLLACASVGSSVIYGHGDAHIIRNWSVVGAILLVACCLVLTPMLGALGAASARFFVQASMIGVGFYLVSSRYGIFLPLNTLGKTLAAGFCSAVLAAYSSRLAGGGGLGVGVGIVCGAVTYLVLVRKLSIISEQDNTTLSRVFARSPFVINRIGSLLLTSIHSR